MSAVRPAAEPPPPLSPVAIAGLERVRRLIDSVRRDARGWVWVEGLALVVLAAAGVFWATLGFDWAVEPPPGARGVMLLASLAFLAAVAARTLVDRLRAPMADASVATVVERGHPGFRDSLSTAVELAAKPAADVDLRLLEKTIEIAAAESARVDNGTLFRRTRLLATAALGAVALATVLGLALARPGVAGVWARRMLLLDETPWPRRTSLSVDGFVDGIRTVARGTDVDLVVLADAAKEVPEMVDLRTRPRRGGSWRTERMGLRGGVDGGVQAFGHVVKGVSEDLEVEIRGGDARLRGLRVAVVDAPALERLEATATLPEYLGGGTRSLPSSRVIQVPRGSIVDLEFFSSKPLASASVTAAEGEQAGEGRSLGSLGDAGAGGDPPRSIAVRAGPVERDSTLLARFTDTDGLANRDPIGVVVVAVPDEAPRVTMRLRGISTAVTPTARVPLEGTIADDHGLESATAEVSVKDATTTALPVARVRRGTSNVEFAADSPEIVDLGPLGLAPGASLSVRVAARDGCTLDGGPNEGASDAWTLDVVTPEALMAMLEAREILLRRRFESVVSDMALARERLAAGTGAAAAPEDAASAAPGDAFAVEAARLAESAGRAAGETTEIVEAVRTIRAELDNNRMLTEELDTRLERQIAAPLAAIAGGDLPALSAAARAAAEADRAALLGRADDVLARMRAVLDKMLELESYNEVIELLRGVIRTQEEIRTETLRRQRQRAKEALERP